MGVVDLPTARYKALGIPFVPGSSIHGILRDARRSVDPEKTEAVFAPPEEPAAHAESLLFRPSRCALPSW